MKRVPLSYILKLANEFERLAQNIDVPLPPATKYLYSNLRRMLNQDLSKEEFLTWQQSNATVLGNKLSDTNNNWFANFENNLQLDLDVPGESSKVVIITTSPKLSSSWDDDKYVNREVIESSVLRSSGNIPAMKLFVVESFSSSAMANIPKEMAHEEYLITAFSELFGRPNHEEMLEFFTKYKKNIDRIRSLFHETPKYLGGGADGVAFSLGTNFILKIFRDTHSFEAAKKAVERLHKHPELAKTEAMIYDVGVLGIFERQHVYYYIMERMKTVRSLDDTSQNSVAEIAREIASRIKNIKSSSLQALKSQIEDPAKYKEIKAEVSKLSSNLEGLIRMRLSHHVDRVEGNLKLKPDWLKLFAEELIMKYLTSRTDLHMGNLGVTQQGELRYFDPAYSDWVSNINL